MDFIKNIIKDETFEIKNNVLYVTYKATGDVGYIKEMEYMIWQRMVDKIG